MKRSFFIFICLLLVSGIPLLSACSQTVEAETRPVVSEGDEEACEVTGYTTYAGPDSSWFLKEGDAVAVIAPSSLPSQVQVDAVVEGLKNWGYQPVLGKYVCDDGRTLENCLRDLRWAIKDSSIKAIFCVRGGYGASELMDEIPKKLLKKTDKMIIGYSDITIFQSAWTTVDHMSIHASMSEAFMGLNQDCAEAEEHMLKGEIPSYRCMCNEFCKQGSAEGVLIGGNLATFTATLGTDYDCTKTEEPYILFLEDVGENMAHIHRYLTLLKHHGVLDRAVGIVFGEWVDRPASDASFDGSSRGGRFSSVAEMISREFLEDSNVPVAFGFPAGHSYNNFPLLMGRTVQLSVEKDQYTLNWP